MGFKEIFHWISLSPDDLLAAPLFGHSYGKGANLTAACCDRFTEPQSLPALPGEVEAVEIGVLPPHKNGAVNKALSTKDGLITIHSLPKQYSESFLPRSTVVVFNPHGGLHI